MAERDVRIEGDRIYLTRLAPDDVTQTYADWLADDEVVRYLECRGSRYTVADLQAYVRAVSSDPRSLLFAIRTKDGRHIGNIKIGGIEQTHRFADIGLLIGDRKAWGNGFGSEAIRLVADYAFEVLGLHKVIAGIYAGNRASLKAFEKAGFRVAGVLKEHRYHDGGYMDEMIVEKRRGEA